MAPFAGAAAADPSSSCAALPSFDLRVFKDTFLSLFWTGKIYPPLELWTCPANVTSAEGMSGAAQGWHPVLDAHAGDPSSPKTMTSAA